MRVEEERKKMNNNDFRRHAHELVDWMADYLKNIESYRVKSPVKPRDIYKQIPTAAPDNGESFEMFFDDFKEIILPGITQWSHPSYFAFFHSHNS